MGTAHRPFPWLITCTIAVVHLFLQLTLGTFFLIAQIEGKDPHVSLLTFLWRALSWPVASAAWHGISWSHEFTALPLSIAAQSAFFGILVGYLWKSTRPHTAYSAFD